MLSFLAEQAGLSAHDAYSTLNMGAGFAVYCAAGQAQTVTQLAFDVGLDADVAGQVEDGPRRVVLEPVDVEFESAELNLAPER